MPLIKSGSDAAFTSNLKAERAAGKPIKQALAIAYSVKRRSRADGGAVDDRTRRVGTAMLKAGMHAPDYGQTMSNLQGGVAQDISDEVPRKGFAAGGMPLIKSGSREAIAANIRTESQTKPHKQAVAIALDVARRAKSRADGGAVDDNTTLSVSTAPTSNFEAASSDLKLTPQEQNIYQHHLTNLNGSGKVMNQDGSISTVYQAVVPGPDGKYYNIPTVWDGKILPVPDAVNRATQNGWGQWPSYATPEDADARYEKMHDYMGEDTGNYLRQQGRATGGPIEAARAVIRRRAAGGSMGAPPPSMLGGDSWFEKREARSLGHTGPVVSAVPGRTDRHSIKVPSSSYVLPADTVSHMGESNSVAGMNAASHIFGHAGPYGSGHGGMSIGHGSGAPAPPHPPKLSKLASGGSDEGGARGDDESGQLVDVIVAGGEHIIPPEIVRNIGRAARAGSAEKGAKIPYHPDDIKIGHRVLDKFVMKTRADHIKTLNKLPEPAKR